MKPKISVVMSVYNAEKYLKQSIESILNQSYKNFEFIIVNDGSKDKSLEIIKSFKDERIILIDQENKGLSKALNAGIGISKGDFIARMDADDISYPDRFEKQMQFLSKNNNCIVLGGNANCIDQKGRLLFTTNLAAEDEEIKNLLPESPFFHSSTIFKKQIFLEVDQYQEDIFQYFEDKILWNKMSNYGTFRNLKDVIIQYRIVPNSISNLPHKKLKALRNLANSIVANNFIAKKEDILKIKEIVNVSQNQKYANYYLRIGAIYLSDNKKLLAFKNLILSFFYIPFERKTSLRLIGCFIPNFIYQKIKSNVKNL
jgi:glycosyltransferase involved in cell wall biosynthesis